MMSMKFSSIIEKNRYSFDFEEIEDSKMVIRSYGAGNNTVIQIDESEIRKLRRYLSQQLRTLNKPK